MRILPLTRDHVARGARLMTAEATEVVADFGDVAAELEAVARGAGLLDRCHRRALALTGPDRVTFLNGQSTNAVGKLAPGHGIYTALLTGKGKLRGHGVVYAEPDRLLLTTDAEASAVTRQHLESFIIMDDVLVTDVSDEVRELAVVGPAAVAAAGEALGHPLDGLAATPYRVDQIAIDDLTVAISAEPATLGAGLVLRTTSAGLPALWTLLARRIQPIGYLAAEALRIEAGLPRWGAELDLDTIPIEADLGHAINYDKGCFTGYEVVARIRTYGHVNRTLVGLDLAASARPSPGAAIAVADKPVGVVTSVATTSRLGHPIALAMIRREASAPATAVRVHEADRWLDAEIRALPFASAAAPRDDRPTA